MDKITPVQGSTQTVAATSTPSSITVDITRTNVRIVSKGPNYVFVRWWNSQEGTQTATTNDLPIPPTWPTVIDIGNADTVGFVCASTETATVYNTMLIED
jgi:hypothetical protein